MMPQYLARFIDRRLIHKCIFLMLCSLQLTISIIAQNKVNPLQFQIHKQVANVTLTLHATNRQDRPVADLKASDFIILENGRPQKLVQFQPAWWHSSKLAAARGFSPVPTAGMAMPFRASYVAFVVDERHLSMYGRENVIRTLGLLSQHLHGRRRWAIFALRHQVHIVQFFTADAQRFRRAASRIGRDPLSRTGHQNWDELLRELNDCHRLDQETSGLMTNDATGSSTVRGLSGGGGENTVGQCGVGSTDIYTEREVIAIQQDLNNLDGLMLFLGGLPGNKQLLYFGNGFSLNPGHMAAEAFSLYGLGNNDMLAGRLDRRPDLNGLASEAVRARVILDMINANGLEAPYPGGIKPGRPRLSIMAAQKLGGNNFMPMLAEEFAEARHVGMMSVAGATGGRAFWQNNDLAAEVWRAIGNRVGTYLAAYTPSNPEMDGKFRRIKVRVLRQGVHIRTRRGYYAIAPRSLPIQAAPAGLQKIQGHWYTPLMLRIRNRDLRWQRFKKLRLDQLIMMVEISLAGKQALIYHRLWLVTLHPGPHGWTEFGTALKLLSGNYVCGLRIVEPTTGRNQTLRLHIKMQYK